MRTRNLSVATLVAGGRGGGDGGDGWTARVCPSLCVCVASRDVAIQREP